MREIVNLPNTHRKEEDSHLIIQMCSILVIREVTEREENLCTI